VRKNILAVAALGLLAFSGGLLMTYVAPPYDPFAHRSHVLYALAWGVALPAVALMAYWISVKGKAWILLAFRIIVGVGFLFFMLTSSYPEDPWPDRLVWSVGIAAVFAALMAVEERIENRGRPK
jgi:4-amino-4-deoxy-L-arabinose transferase-like glycosyltransferase